MRTSNAISRRRLSRVASSLLGCFARLVAVLGAFSSVSIDALASTTHKGLTLQAFIKKPDSLGGGALTQTGTAVKLQILSPSTNCVLMEESHSNVNITDGIMNLVVGAGTRVNSSSPTPGSDKGYSLAEILENKTARTGLDQAATVGSANCNYTPSVSGQDPRIVRVSFLAGSDTLQADFTVRSTAYAVEAERLEGKAATDFVQINASKNVTQQTLEDYFNALTSAPSGNTGVLWNGTSFSSYDPSSGSGLADSSVPWSKLTSVPSPLSQIGALSCSNGQILKYSGAAWACAVETGGSVTLNTGTSGTAPAFSGSGTSYTLNIPMASASGVTAGLISKTDYDSFAAKLDASSTLAVGNGGTGATSLGSGNILIGGGTGAVTSLAAGSAGNVPYATGAATWASGSPDTAGLVDKSSTQTISGAKFFGADLSLVLQHALLFKDADSSNYVALRAPATVAADRTFTLPGTYGSNGDVLTSDGSGGLSWTAGGGSGTVSGTTGTIAKFTSGTAVGDSVIVESSGNIGIGTSSPARRLDVVSSAANDTMFVQNTNVAGWSAIRFEHYTGGNVGAIGYGNPGAANNAAEVFMKSNGLNDVTFGTNSTERMRIKSDGKVGIGTSSPISTFDVGGTGGGILSISNPSTNVLSSEELAALNFYTYDPSFAAGIASSIKSVAEDNGAAYSMVFSTRNSSGAYPSMTFNSDGLFKVGTNTRAGSIEIDSAGFAVGSSTFGTSTGALHIVPYLSGDDKVYGITFGAYDTPSIVTTAQAGLYIQSSPSYGTKMHLATSNSYAAGSKARVTIDESGKVGIGTMSPSATLDIAGHVASSGAAPSISSCGTSPTSSGTDTRGTVTIGSGSVTSCTITFATAYATAPFCVVSWTGTPVPTMSLSVVSTQNELTVHFSADANSRAFNFICMQ